MGFEMATRTSKPKCQTRGCEREVLARKRCVTHYGRIYRRADFVPGRRGQKSRRKYPETGSPSEIARKLGVTRQCVHHHMHKEKTYARQRVAWAVKAGKITRPANCVRCSKCTADLEAHHPDYSKPLDVQWLCVPCHNVVHPHPPTSWKKAKTREELLEIVRQANLRIAAAKVAREQV